ncbi:hypothetical protein OCQ_22240 [Mycobacterium paraintracellulare]|nr:hypothetical protein OCQ_22240 [Mycobacterium paraintracellulare]
MPPGSRHAMPITAMGVTGVAPIGGESADGQRCMTSSIG